MASNNLFGNQILGVVIFGLWKVVTSGRCSEIFVDFEHIFANRLNLKWYFIFEIKASVLHRLLLVYNLLLGSFTATLGHC